MTPPDGSRRAPPRTDNRPLLHGDNRRLFLAERLEDEGKRLAENA